MFRRSAPTAQNADSLRALLLIAAVLVCYAPALNGAPVWDDERHITAGALQGVDGLWRIWFSPGATQQYYPVLHSAFWLEHRLWGDFTMGYHLINVVLHSVSSVLIVLLARRLEAPGAWIAGFVFALHPVNVESVAWISEQKNTLSLALALGSALCWLRFDASRRHRDWAAAFVLFLLALGTKTVTGTLPCVLIVVVWWQRGRIDARRDLLPLIPWLAAGVAGGLFTAWVERTLIGASGAEFVLSPLQRLLLAPRAVWHYALTYAWPAALAFTYPRWIISPRSAAAYLYPLAILVAFAWLWHVRGRNRGPLAAALIFVGMLFPVLGFLNVYPFRYSFVADHFQYHANVPLAIVTGAGVAALLRASAQSRYVLAGAGLAFATLASLTWRQAGEYRDAETLYRATLARNPESWMAHHNLGRILLREPDGLPEAAAHFEAAIALKPDHARAHYSLGVALERLGRGAEAVPHFEAAIRYEPGNVPLVTSSEFLLGVEAMRRPDGAADAVRHFEAAQRLTPGIAETDSALAEARRRAAAPPRVARRAGQRS